MDDLSKYWLLPNASSQDYGIAGDMLINYTHVFMLILFVGWGAFFLWCLVRYRAKEGQRASYTPIKAKASKVLELGIVIFEGFLLVGLSMPAWGQYKREPPADSEVLNVRLVAHQFQWEFHYPGPDGVYGKTDPALFSGTNPLGLIDEPGDPNSYDDIYSPAHMVMPVNKTVRVEVSSLDVIHSFAIPQLRVKQDAVPGMTVPVWFVPAEIGEYDIVCSQLCGNSHYKMGGKAKVVSQADYDKWVQEGIDYRREYLELPPLGETGEGEPTEGEPTDGEPGEGEPAGDQSETAKDESADAGSEPAPAAPAAAPQGGTP